MLHPYVKHLDLEAETITPWNPVGCFKNAYHFPINLPGGSTVAIIELGGGFLSTDIATFCTKYGIPDPVISEQVLPGSPGNQPDGSDASVEVTLDMELAAAAYSVATGKSANLLMIWCPATSQGIINGINAAHTAGAAVCSISWGADEAEWGTNAGDALEFAAEQSCIDGMTTFAASGDNDSSDGGSGAANVDLPASAPHVVGCGGTKLPRGGEEVVWGTSNPDGSGTGGGYSTLFPVQAWQVGAPPPKPAGRGRMVPDVTGNADPSTGFRIVFRGKTEVVGGTSCVAPFYAGLFAAFGKRFGFLGPTLWANQGDFTDITKGTNGYYAAAVGPDPCSGVGSPIGTKLANTLR